MKKSIYLSAAALAVLAASCSQDDGPIAGADGMTTFRLQLPQNFATRFGEGTDATKLSVAVYDKTGKLLMSNTDGSLPEGAVVNDFAGGSLTTTVQIPLVKNEQYNILFWAQDPSANFYTLNVSDKTLGVSYDGAKSGDESRDAFYCYYNLDKSTGGTHEVTLTRPFAQVNIATSDLDAAKKAGLTVSTAGVAFSKGDLATNFNFATGEASAPTQAATVFQTNYQPTQKLVVGDAEYSYLSMAYVLVPAQTTTQSGLISNVDLLINDNSNKFATYSNVPVQLNYRTNIYGALLTNPEVFTVTIEPNFESSFIGFGGENFAEMPQIDDASKSGTINKASELAGLGVLVNAGNNYSGYTFTLANDVDMAENTQFAGIGSEQRPFSGTFDGTGHTISNLNANLFGNLDNATVKNFTASGNTNTAIIAKYTNGTTNIENVTAQGTAEGGRLVIKKNPSNSSDDIQPESYGAAGFVSQVQSGVLNISNSNNEAAVTGTEYAAAGFVANGRYATEMNITDCHNKGNITCTSPQYAHAAGIVATGLPPVSGAHNDIPWTIENCTNDGTIVANTSKRVFACGIIGFNVQATTVKNCVNNGSIKAHVEKSVSMNCASGIAGTDFSLGRHEFTGCTNNGNVEITGTLCDPADLPHGNNNPMGNGYVQALYAGGVIANVTYNELIINDCKNYGNITAKALDNNLNIYVGGICGMIGWYNPLVFTNNTVGSQVKLTGETAAERLFLTAFYTNVGGITANIKITRENNTNGTSYKSFYNPEYSAIPEFDDK